MVYESGFAVRSPMGFDEMMCRNIYNSAYNKMGMPKVNVTPTGYVKINEVTIKATVTTNQNRTFVYEQRAKVEP